MKLRKILYLVLAIFFVMISLLTNILNLPEYKLLLSQDPAYGFGYILGSQITLVVGLFFFRKSYKFHKRIKAQEESIILDEFGKDV